MKLILQTRRLTLRELEKEDVGALRLILQDPLVMYAWEHAFTDAEIRGWIETNQARYQKDGCGYWAAQASETGKLIGMLGLLMEELDGERKLGLGYFSAGLLGHGLRHRGAQALLDEAFYKRNASEVIAEIRPENIPSRRVAERLGMRAEGELVKHYRGKDMPHLIYVKRSGAKKIVTQWILWPYYQHEELFLQRRRWNAGRFIL